MLPLSVFADGPLLTESDFFANHVAEGVPRTVPSFAAHVRSHLDAKKTTPDWPEFWSGERFAKIAAAAKSTMDYRIKTCGTWHQYEKGKIDWRFNPTCNGYKEYVWQLGRHYFLTDLAAYYSVAKDQRAAETWRDVVTSWIRQATCDEKIETGFDGTCWRSLDAALRVEGWSRQFPVFKDAPGLDDDFVALLMRSVWEHGRHLRRFPTSRNWLVYEMTGLLRLAVTFPFFRESDDWKAFALETLEKELGAQLYPDGFHYELSSGYHSVIDENYGALHDFLNSMGEPPPKFLDAGLENAFALYTYLARPDGRLPALGDAGEELVKPVMERASKFYPDRQDFRWLATGGKKGAPPPFTSIALPWSGAVVMRAGWGAKDIWAYMDCGPIGRGHQHEDKLNVLLWAYGHEMLTEGGIFNYDTSEMRQYVLRTRSHNAARIDNRGQNRRAGYVWHGDDLHKKAPFKFAVTPEVEWARADYTDGYGEKREVEASQRRTLIFYKAVNGLKPFFAVVDRLAAGDGRAHEYEIIWH
ncbi:MAG: alginate lyase family protein, partial [Kiritimatiellae bacterium]|nr:alginate lyase family protein [Kiritimatiellia bacterium]